MPNLDMIYDVTRDVTWDERKTNKQVIYQTISLPSFVTFDAFYSCLWPKTLSFESYLGGKALATDHRVLSITHPALRVIHPVEEGKMAGSVRNMENLFEQQDREELSELNSYNSGGFRFKGSESSALSLLNKLRLEGEGGFCDVTLEVEGRQLATHRCVLAASSQFFYTMFSSGMKESNETLLKLHSVSFDSMSLILDYFYTREIVISDDNVLELLNTASFLLVTPVKKACIQILNKQLSIENCFSILQVAEQFGASELVKRASNYIKENFFSAVNNEEFVSISKKSLIDFISSDEIQVEREEEVYQAVLKWVKYDEENRVSDLPELLSHLRGKSLPQGFLKSEMSKEPLLAAFSSLVESSKRKIKTKWTKKKRGKRTGADDKPEAERTRTSTELHNVMIGISSIYGFCKAFCYDLDKEETFVLSDYPNMHVDPELAVTGRSLYIIGGSKLFNGAPTRLSALCLDEVKNQRKPSFSIFSMDPEWETKAPCKVSRIKASLAQLNGLLYYIGGWLEDGSCCNTVECYNPEMDEWVYCASLNTSRSRSGCVTGNGHIYIIGGGTAPLAESSETFLSSVERFV